MWKYLNKGISTPIAVSIILILSIIVGGFTWWQYSEMVDFKIKVIDITRKDMTCNEKCKSLGYLSGSCRSWAVLPDAKVGCNVDEAAVKGASDCKIEKIMGVGKQCCCKTGVANFEDCVAKGYPILESYPRQCETPDGRIFGEEIEDGTADWKTHRSEDYGFELEYPEDWYVESFYVRNKKTGEIVSSVRREQVDSEKSYVELIISHRLEDDLEQKLNHISELTERSKESKDLTVEEFMVEDVKVYKERNKWMLSWTLVEPDNKGFYYISGSIVNFEDEEEFLYYEKILNDIILTFRLISD